MNGIGVVGDMRRHVIIGPQHHEPVFVAKGVEGLRRQGIAHLAGFFQVMRDCVRTPDAPAQLPGMDGSACVAGGFQFGPVRFAVPFRDAELVAGQLQASTPPLICVVDSQP